MSRTTRTTTKRSARKTTQTPKRALVLNDSLHAMPLDEAFEVFLDLDAGWSLIPDGHEDQLRSDWDAVVRACGSLGIDTVHGLLTQLPAVLTATTGIENVTEYHTGADQALLHRTRSAALTVAVATAPNHDPAAILETTRKTLRARTSLPARALVDDEITLLRTVAAVTASGTPTSQRAAVYALCDAGMLSSETTSADVSDIVGPIHEPTAILASGTTSGRVIDRLVPLEAFHRRALGPTIAAATARGPKTLLTYKPAKNQPGTFAAAASANAIIGRLLADCGLAHTDTTPASLHRWRITTTWNTYGPAVAMELGGRADLEATRRHACISLEPTPTTSGADADNFMDYAA